MNLTPLSPLSPRAKAPGTRGAALVSALAIAGLVLAGCSSNNDDGASADAGASTGGGAGSTSGDSGTADGSGNGRVFNASDDAVVKAIMAATPAESAAWQGDTLRVTFAEEGASGTSSGLGAGSYCRIVAALLDDDERAVLAYSDGEVDCEEQG